MRWNVVISSLALALGLLLPSSDFGDLSAATKTGAGVSCRPWHYGWGSYDTAGFDGVTRGTLGDIQQQWWKCEVHGVASSITIQNWTLYIDDHNTQQDVYATWFVRTEADSATFGPLVYSPCHADCDPSCIPCNPVTCPFEEIDCGYQTLTQTVNQSFTNIIAYGLHVYLPGANHGAGTPFGPMTVRGWSMEVL